MVIRAQLVSWSSYRLRMFIVHAIRSSSLNISFPRPVQSTSNQTKRRGRKSTSFRLIDDSDVTIILTDDAVFRQVFARWRSFVPYRRQASLTPSLERVALAPSTAVVVTRRSDSGRRSAQAHRRGTPVDSPAAPASSGPGVRLTQLTAAPSPNCSLTHGREPRARKPDVL